MALDSIVPRSLECGIFPLMTERVPRFSSLAV